MLLIVLLANFTCARAPSEANQQLFKEMTDWFHSPQAIPPWQFESLNQQAMLVASSTYLGGGNVYKTPNRQPCIVSVPHRFYDIDTLTIGQSIYAHVCQVLLSNTQHRNADSPDGETMDLAKRHHSIHNSAIQAYYSINPNAKTFQLHGFSNTKRKSKIAQQADIIISQGKQFNEDGKRLTQCLNKAGFKTYLYGKSIYELGGTTNIIHKLGITPFSFFHLEMNRTTRKQLVQKPILLRKITLCLKHLL